MKLTKTQKDFLKTIKNKDNRKYQKQQFKIQNKFDKDVEVIHVVFKNGVFRTNNPSIIKYLNGLLSVKPFEKTSDTIIWNDRFVEDKNSLTKETLESLTNPDLLKKEKDFEDAIDKHLLSEDTIFSNNMLSKNHKPKKASLAETSQDTLDWMHKIGQYAENKNLEFDLPKTSQKLDELINAIKLTYSQEDMFKCFQESRLTTHPLTAVFKFNSFASYLESIQK